MHNKTLREHKFRLLLMCDLRGDIGSAKFNNDNLEELEKMVTGNVDLYASYIREDFDSDEDEMNAESDALTNNEIELFKNFLRRISLNISNIDDIIIKNLKNWRFDRLAKEDINILRLCVYEMYYDDSVDVKVAINEAINLAKDYGNEKVGKFINGILRSVYESQKEQDS